MEQHTIPADGIPSGGMARGVRRPVVQRGTLALAALAVASVTVPVQACYGAGTAQAMTHARSRVALRVALPGPVSCSGNIYESVGTKDTLGTYTQLYRGIEGAGGITFTRVGGLYPDGYNAISIDPVSDVLYGMDRTTDHLLAISPAGAITDVGAVSGLPPHVNEYDAGAFDTAGDFYVQDTSGRPGFLYKINVATRTATGIHLSRPTRAADFAYARGYLWGVNSDGHVVRVNRTTGGVLVLGNPGITPVYPGGPTGAGGAFTYGNGDVGIINNTKPGVLYRLSISNPASRSPLIREISSQRAPSATHIDAASCLRGDVDLGIMKRVASPSYTAGGPVSYTLTVTDHGPDASSGSSVSDVIPPSITGPRTSAPGCSITKGRLSCTHGPLPVGASYTITVTGTAAARATGVIRNTATVAGNEPDPSPLNNTSTATTSPASLTIMKTATPSSASRVGLVITYSFRVTNTSAVTLHNIKVKDTQAAPAVRLTSGPACPRSSLAPGASETCTATYKVTAADIRHRKVRDSAVATGTTPGGQAVTSHPSAVTVAAVMPRVPVTG